MRCTKAQDYLSRELDGLVPPDATVRLHDHIDACPKCREFREDLLVGRRLLAASAPGLPDNFDWKLQLRLNQALQQRAGETAYPWQDKPAGGGLGRWLPTFGAAASVGLAAVLAVAIFVGPSDKLPAGVPLASETSAAQLAGRTDRSSLFAGSRSPGLYRQGIQRNVAAGGLRATAAPTAIDRGWSGERLEDLQTIQNLRERNDQLMRMVYQYQLQIRNLKAPLDSSRGDGIDLGESR